MCNSVSDARSMQLQFSRPAVRSNYRPVASDFFDHYRYPVTGLAHTGEGVCSCGFEHTRTHYGTWNGRSHRWTSTVDVWHRTRQPDDLWLRVSNSADHCCSSYSMHNCFDAFICDHCCPSSVKRRAQFFSEQPVSHHCHCCNVAPGLCRGLGALYLVGMCILFSVFLFLFLSSSSFLSI